MNSSKLVSKVKEEINQKKSSNKLETIKNNYFIQRLFNHLEKKKLLSIIRYNKNIKDRIHINNKDYKDYSEKYSSIEIEIIPVKNKYDNFIRIKTEDELYYHIYFNNNEEEIKRKYIKKHETIEVIKVKIDYQITSFKDLFYHCDYIEVINFKQFSRTNIKDMSGMFNGCKSLKELNLNNFNTSNVTDMSYMFCGCSLLKELNFNNFSTNNVINMIYMFFNCSSLKELNLNNFDTNKVYNMNHMFYGCSSLNKLFLNNFNTKNVISMANMFSECSSLKELYLNNFDTNKVVNMNHMFSGCSSLKELNLFNFNTNLYCTYMFKGCSNELKTKIKNQFKYIKEEAFKE